MIQNIRQILFQMLVLADYEGDKESFLNDFIRNCQKSMPPAFASRDEYYAYLHKSARKSIQEFVESLSTTLSPSQLRNITLLSRSFE